MSWTHEGRSNQPKAQGPAKLAGLELAKCRPGCADGCELLGCLKRLQAAEHERRLSHFVQKRQFLRTEKRDDRGNEQRRDQDNRDALH